jgi:hypothetical protein
MEELRRWLPIWNTLPVRFCALISISPSEALNVHGFST